MPRTQYAVYDPNVHSAQQTCRVISASVLMIGCFGAQAVLGGLFIWFSVWTRTTFLVYALALLPFFWFNYWFVYEVLLLASTAGWHSISARTRRCWA